MLVFHYDPLFGCTYVEFVPVDAVEGAYNYFHHLNYHRYEEME